MATQSVDRKLTAIMFTDIVGFTSLMRADEKWIQQYRSNVVFRNYLIANRANKRLMKANVIKLIKDTKNVIDKIDTTINNI